MTLRSGRDYTGAWMEEAAFVFVNSKLTGNYTGRVGGLQHCEAVSGLVLCASSGT